MFLGTCADYNLCVSKAMQRDLDENWNVKSTVLYDKAPLRFKELQLVEKTEFLKNQKYFELDRKLGVGGKEKRDFIIVSSTSWTPDEDFRLLLDALCEYNRWSLLNDENAQHAIKITCIITGKGPMKNE